MRSSILNKSQRNLARSAAVLLIGRYGHGMQFQRGALQSAIDDIFTVDHESAPDHAGRPTALPGRQTAAGQPVAPATGPVQPVASNGSVGRSTLEPVAGTQPAGIEPEPVASAPVADAAARAEACCDRGRRRGARRRRYRRQIRSPGGPVGRRRCQGMVARWRQPDYSQGRRDRLQSVAPVRGAR